MRNYVCELSVHFSDEFMVFILILCLSEYNVMFVFLKLFYLFIYFNNVGPIRVSLHHYTNTFWCATISISFQGFPAPPPKKNQKPPPKNAVTQQAIQQTAYEAPVSQFGNRSYAKGSRIAWTNRGKKTPLQYIIGMTWDPTAAAFMHQAPQACCQQRHEM